jgi:hypothetical protein
MTRLIGLTATLVLLGTHGCSDDGAPTPDAALDAAASDTTMDSGADSGADADSADADSGGPQKPCALDYDCPAGQKCLLGLCEPFVPQCKEKKDCQQDEVCLEGLCLQTGTSPLIGAVIFNEVLADGSTNGDANGDGSSDAVEDEFVELVNVGNKAVDLSGWTLVEADWGTALPRHTFAANTVLQPLGVIVLFGGGNPPSSSSGVQYLVVNAKDPGIPFGLDLDDGGDLVKLLDAKGLTVAVFPFGNKGGAPAASDTSLTRDPDLTGSITPHTQAAKAAGAVFSPGTRVDGTKL